MGNWGSSSSPGKYSAARDIVNYYKLNGADLKGKIVVVTGGNAGIGLETVKCLAEAGATVVMCSRSREKAQKAIDSEIKNNGLGGYKVSDVSKIIVMELDLESLESVARFAKELEATVDKIDYLILNAGIMACPYRLTAHGFESQMGTNYFGHYHLVDLLWKRMKQQKHATRIVELSSIAHTFGKVVVDDINFTNGRTYDPWRAYGQSKLANILHIHALRDLAQKEAPHIKCFSVHPGVISTGLTQNMSFLGTIAYYFYSDKNVPQGASTTVYACLSPSLEDHSGAYLVDCAVAQAKLPEDHSTLAADLHKAGAKEIAEALHRGSK